MAVFWPVKTIIALAVPLTTVVPYSLLVSIMRNMQGRIVVCTENRMFVMSCLTARRSGTTSVDLFTLTLSPVRIAWSTRKLLDDIDINLQSAGTRSPTATDIISPGTSSDACMRETWPERSTVASSGEYSFKA